MEEALSQLIDGDLPEDEAHALRIRIAQEPEVARAYGEMLALIAQLGDLPEEVPVPRRQRPWLAMMGWSAAAVAAVMLFWPRAPAIVIQTSDETLYTGAYQVHAGDSEVSIDGTVSIRVEPEWGPMRERGQEDSMKAITHVGAAALGGLLTITVYEGSARVLSPDTPAPVVVEEGQSRTFGEPRRRVVVRTPRGAGVTDAERVAQLEAELGKVQEALGQERFAKVLMQGQLEAERGQPTDWPDDLAAALTATEFPKELAALMAGQPDVEVLTADCAEYPCIGALRYTGDDENWGRPLGKKIGDWADAALDGEVNLAIANMESGEDGEDPQRLMLFTASNEPQESNASKRSRRRMQEIGSELLQE